MYPIAPTTQAVFSPPAQTQLKDDFGTSIVTIGALQRLCLPATKTRLDTGQSFPPQNPDAHLICWGITDPNFTPKKVHTTNQFGDAMLDVLAAHSEAAPVAAAEPTPTNVTQPAATLARLSELPLHDSRKCAKVRETFVVGIELGDQDIDLFPRTKADRFMHQVERGGLRNDAELSPNAGSGIRSMS